MNIHEQIDRFLNLNARPKRIIIFSILLVIFVILAATFYLGFNFGHGWADSDYLEERQKRMEQIQELETRAKVHEVYESKLLRENAVRKKQNEATAEILRSVDEKTRGDVQKLEQLTKEREKQIDQINSDNDYLNQIRGICQDYKEAKFPELSFCSRFKENQP